MAKKILFAVGVTGGHLFPAQALAEDLLGQEPTLDILFAGARLNTNTFLDKKRFRFKEVLSATHFRTHPFRASATLLKGSIHSLSLLKKEKPDLVIGFGSYHSFPLLLAATLLRIPFILFEADAIPGRVNRLFSRYAQFTAVHLSHSQAYLKGKSVPVLMPSKHREDTLSQSQARHFLGLNPDTFTLFVFGGSQGAQGINQHIPALLSLWKKSSFPLQLIHITGQEKSSSLVKKTCEELGIACYVREFEPHMRYLWRASTLVIGRAGASTLSEMIHFEVPGILIPYPYATNAHQHMNAQFLEKEVGAGICLLEEKTSPETLLELVQMCTQQLNRFKEAMHFYKSAQNASTLANVIYEFLA